MSTYIKNLETGKIELHFDKADYMALPDEQKKQIKSAFLFSRYVGAWVSRTKEPNNWRVIEIAKKLGLDDGGEKGEKLSFSEQVEQRQEKAERRAERFQARAKRASGESDRAYNKAKDISSYIPFGQPILVGHHSEARHRRDLKKIDDAMRKSCEADDKAKYYEHRAAAAEYNASDAKFKSVKYLLNRIDECNKQLRAIERSLQGKDMINKATGERMVDGCEISEVRRDRLNNLKAEWLDKLDFFKAKLDEAGGGELNAKRLKELQPKYVKIGNEWWPLKSINRDTVTVWNWLKIATFTWKFRIGEIKAVEAGYLVQVFDRDGNEVKPTIKY